jgi:hypothetical protein
VLEISTPHRNYFVRHKEKQVLSDWLVALRMSFLLFLVACLYLLVQVFLGFRVHFFLSGLIKTESVGVMFKSSRIDRSPFPFVIGKHGFLEKRGDFISHGWRKRFFRTVGESFVLFFSFFSL